MSVFEILVPVMILTIVGVLLSLCILVVKNYFCSGEECVLLINEEKEEKISAGGTLLEVLLKLGYGVPAPCGGKATCHQCKVQVQEGGDQVNEVETMIFSPKKINEGWRLSCQCKVKSSMKVHMDPSCLNVTKYKAAVTSNENVSTFIKELCVQIPKDQMFDYIPGDYMQIHMPFFTTETSNWKETIEEKYQEDWNKFSLFGKKIVYDEEDGMRAYSLASYPEEGNILKFTVRIATPPFKGNTINSRINWGIGSSYIFSLKEGDEVDISGPYGESHMIENDKELIFLIGGAGASFARSHILDLFYNKKTNRKVTLWYGARSLKENIYQEEFEQLDKDHENFTYRLVLSEPDESDKKGGWDLNDPIKTGYAVSAFEKGQLGDMDAPEDSLYYVCGPPMHNKSVMKLLYDYGVDRHSIVLDDFGN